MNRPRTLPEKNRRAHVAQRREDDTCLLHTDRHFVHEVTNAQAFERLLCCLSMAAASPALAKAPVKQADVRSDEWQRHRAIEESIGRMQLDDLIASIVDTDGKHPAKTQRAARGKSNRTS